MSTKTKQILNDGTETPATYHHENIQYKDLYDINKLNSNTTYSFRVQVKNEYEWSEWSQLTSVKTHSDDTEKIAKHKSTSSHHHRHHERKHKNLGIQQANVNTKRDRFNSYLAGMY